jgi:hypothetical protein
MQVAAAVMLKIVGREAAAKAEKTEEGGSTAPPKPAVPKCTSTRSFGASLPVVTA